MDDIYNNLFLQAKQNFLKLGIPESELDSYIYDPTKHDINKEAYQDMQWCNNYILNGFDFSGQRGLCTYLCSMGSSAYTIASKINMSFITIGKVLHNDKNIFKVPKKDVLIEKFIEEQKTTQDVQLGGRMHAWITLENGLIVDPSLYHTLYQDGTVLVERPLDMQTKFNLVYKPYVVTGMDDMTKVHKLIESHEQNEQNIKKEVFKRYINNNYSELNYSDITKKF
ncbi:hypothetical protein [Sulfurimonas sp.]|uniref:hypothetical protein n=1 Tax=Sulfurimonas sp. TaxID=2022749 RepID=UPI0025DA3A36|nr:hypothetical protein [Sulfurimonas sp.]